MKNKKVVYTIIGIIALVLVALAITYAYWQITKTQEGVNEITTACLDITLVDAEEGNTGVTLQNQYPISDTEGAALTPYKFTVTNNCDTEVDYQIALESTGNSTDALSTSSLKVMLDSNAAVLLNTFEGVTPTISGAYASHKLGTSTLAATGEEGSSATHELRLWIDETAPVEENNKSYTGKITVTIGQGIEASVIKEGSLAYTVLDVYDNVQTLAANSSYYFSDSYSINEFGYAVDCNNLNTLYECYTTGTCGKYAIPVNNSCDGSQELYEISEYISYNSEDNTITINITPPGSIAKAKDDYGDSYYFRGNVTNNYVKFGTFTEEIAVYRSPYNDYESLEDCTNANEGDCEKITLLSSGTPIYWRIIRINGDGTIRLIYDGEKRYSLDEERHEIVGMGIEDATYAPSPWGKKMYVGYMYGTEEDPYGDNDETVLTDSTAKVIADAWYEKNLKTNYGSYIADRVFCNDREEHSTDEYGNVTYSAKNRYLNNTPVLTCENKRDRFTVDDEVLGNGHLTNPIGLITEDEVIMAGKSGYLTSGEFWTMTPSSSSESHATMFANQNADQYVEYDYWVRPVINLKADVKFTIDDDGTYVITTN